MTITGEILSGPNPRHAWAIQAMEESGQEPLSSWTGMPRETGAQSAQKDALLNDEALKSGDRIISAYSTLKGVKPGS